MRFNLVIYKMFVSHDLIQTNITNLLEILFELSIRMNKTTLMHLTNK